MLASINPITAIDAALAESCNFHATADSMLPPVHEAIHRYAKRHPERTALIIGGAVLATVNNGMGLLGLPASVVFLVNGIVLLLAAGVDVLSRRRSAETGR